MYKNSIVSGLKIALISGLTLNMYSINQSLVTYKLNGMIWQFENTSKWDILLISKVSLRLNGLDRNRLILIYTIASSFPCFEN